jgi:hypothetical protein
VPLILISPEPTILLPLMVLMFEPLTRVSCLAFIELTMPVGVIVV